MSYSFSWHFQVSLPFPENKRMENRKYKKKNENRDEV